MDGSRSPTFLTRWLFISGGYLLSLPVMAATLRSGGSVVPFYGLLSLLLICGATYMTAAAERPTLGSAILIWAAALAVCAFTLGAIALVGLMVMCLGSSCGTW